MHDLTFTIAQLRVLKAYLADKGLFFPNSNDHLVARRKHRPVIRVELNVNSMVKGTYNANFKSFISATQLGSIFQTSDTTNTLGYKQHIHANCFHNYCLLPSYQK